MEQAAYISTMGKAVFAQIRNLCVVDNGVGRVVVNKVHDGVPYMGSGTTLIEALEAVDRAYAEDRPYLAPHHTVTSYSVSDYDLQCLRGEIGVRVFEKSNGQFVTLIAITRTGKRIYAWETEEE